jgi:hypothetical protein
MADGVEGQLQACLGEKLRGVYQSVVEETVPERLRNLLDALEHREKEIERTSAARAGRSRAPPAPR